MLAKRCDQKSIAPLHNKYLITTVRIDQKIPWLVSLKPHMLQGAVKFSSTAPTYLLHLPGGSRSPEVASLPSSLTELPACDSRARRRGSPHHCSEVLCGFFLLPPSAWELPQAEGPRQTGGPRGQGCVSPQAGAHEGRAVSPTHPHLNQAWGLPSPHPPAQPGTELVPPVAAKGPGSRLVGKQRADLCECWQMLEITPLRPFRN